MEKERLIMLATEIAKQIRADLKKAGYKAREISVRSDYAGYSQAIRLTIKKAHIRKSDVEKIARQYESVARCEVSGEILLGGNTYVTVEYERDVFDVAYEKYLKFAEQYIWFKGSCELRKGLWVIGDNGYVMLCQEGENNYNLNFRGNPYTLALCLYAYEEFGDIRWWN